MLKLTVKMLLMMVVSPLVMANAITPNKPWQTNLQQLKESHPVKEVGSANFSFLMWDIYNSQLSTSNGKYPITNQQDTLMYTINYQRDISSSDLVERTIEQWHHINTDKDIYMPYVNKLRDMWPDIKKGDSLALVSNQSGSGFYYNNDFVGSIANEAFSPLFLSIWLSEKTSEPELRQQLLGDSNE
jgi:hypothetical protein